MNTRSLLGVVAFGVCALLAASNASAAPINCGVTPGAIANGEDPTLCASGNYTGNPTSQTGFMNTEFQGLGDPFTFIGKTENPNDPNPSNETVGDWVLSLGAGVDPWDFSFGVSSATYVGHTVDFVLLVKIGNNDHAYYWESLVLDITGFYNSFNITGQGTAGEPDFSHVSAFVRFGESVTVPAPGPLALLGLGLLGLGFARRRFASR